MEIGKANEDLNCPVLILIQAPPLRTSQTDAAPNLVISPDSLFSSNGILLATLEPADKNPTDRTHIQSR